MNQSIVSVIIPIYNVERYIEKGIQSILNQTYQNLEIILVDDGSTDLSGKLCDEISKKDDRIRVFHKQNGGPGSARNYGIDMANGEFLYFFDIDDSVDLNMISDQMNIMNDYNTDLIIFGFDVRYEGKDEVDNIGFYEEFIKCNKQLKLRYQKDLAYTKNGNGFVWNKFYRKSFLNQHNIHFGNQYFQQDELFNLKIYLNIDKVYINPKSYYHYVIYSKGNVTTTYLPNKLDIYNEICREIEYDYKQWNLHDERLNTLLLNRFVGGVYHCVTVNCFHEDAHLSFKQKYEYIYNIIHDQKVEAYVCKVWKSWQHDPIKFMIKHKMTLGIIIGYKVKLFLKSLFRR